MSNKTGKHSKIFWPDSCTFDFAPEDHHENLRRVGARLSMQSIEWLHENEKFLWPPDNMFNSEPWASPSVGQVPAPVGESDETFCIFKTHQVICATAGTDRQKQLANAFLSYLVWFKRSSKPDDAVGKEHILLSRALLKYAVTSNLLPSTSGELRSSDWIHKIVSENHNPPNRVLGAINLVQRILGGEVTVGQRRAREHRKKPRAKMNIAYCRGFISAQRPYPPALSHSRPSFEISNSGGVKPKNDEYSPQLVVGPTPLDTESAKFLARHRHTSTGISGISGAHHLETYSSDVVEQLLSALTPKSAEASYVMLILAMGAKPSDFKKVQLQNNSILIPAFDKTTAHITVALPFTLGINEQQKHSTNQKALKKSFQHCALGSRLTLDGIARFSQHAFFGHQGIVISEILHGQQSKSGVAAIYTSFTDAQVQCALNDTLSTVCQWIQKTELDTKWHLWAKEIQAEPKSIQTPAQKFGSPHSWLPNDTFFQTLSTQLAHQFSRFKTEKVGHLAREYARNYLRDSAVLLNLTYMALTGGRPLTKLTQIAIGPTHLTIIDKQCFNTRENRTISVPEAFITALKNHLQNVFHIAAQHSLTRDQIEPQLRHPFVYLTSNKKKVAALTEVSPAEVHRAMQSSSNNPALPSNAIRHGFATKLHAINDDGRFANLMGHERGAISNCSPYVSSPAMTQGLSPYFPIRQIEVLKW